MNSHARKAARDAVQERMRAERDDAPLRKGEQTLHDHYAAGALARGHAAGCSLVTTPRNWPTAIHAERLRCTCGRVID